MLCPSVSDPQPSLKGSASRREARTLLLSLFLQFVLALAFGHSYDVPIFLSTGYLVGSGQNPYAIQDLSSVFHHPAFRGLPIVGYPPPWPILLGFAYRATYALFPNLLLYNLAIKIPVVAANVGLAYLVAAVVRRFSDNPQDSHKAWVFLLFNPALLYFGTAWGQFDSIVALLSLGSLVLLHEGKSKRAAVLLSLAIAFKPTALPLLPAALAYLAQRSPRETLRFAGAFVSSLGILTVAPFLLLGWRAEEILRHWNAHFSVGGGMSAMSLLEVLRDSYQLPGTWWLLGLAWIPALGVGILASRSDGAGFPDLLRRGTALVLIFFLTRTWLSEPNVILILPMVLLLTSLGRLDRRALAAVWVLPLVFTVLNDSPPQLLFPTFPDSIWTFDALAENLRSFRLLARSIVVIPWQLAGWWIVLSCLRRRSGPQDQARWRVDAPSP